MADGTSYSSATTLDAPPASRHFVAPPQDGKYSHNPFKRVAQRMSVANDYLRDKNPFTRGVAQTELAVVNVADIGASTVVNRFTKTLLGAARGLARGLFAGLIGFGLTSGVTMMVAGVGVPALILVGCIGVFTLYGAAKSYHKAVVASDTVGDFTNNVSRKIGAIPLENGVAPPALSAHLPHPVVDETKTSWREKVVAERAQERELKGQLRP